MKNRRLLTHPELEPHQIRAVDAFSDFNSEIVNNLTKICHRTDQSDVIVDGLDVVENCPTNAEYFSQDLINYDKFSYVDNCQRAPASKDLQIFAIDNDVEDIKIGYAEQNLADNECLRFSHLCGSDITRTFAVTFGVTEGTANSLFISIGDSVLDLRYLDGAYEEKTKTYTVFLDVNFKNLTKNLPFKIGAYLDVLDYRNFFSHDDLNGVSYMTISNISCKMLIRDRSRDLPIYGTDTWDSNHLHALKNLRVTEGTAVKDNVVLNSLQSVNVGNSAVVLDLSNPKAWIHSNPYTATDFYNDRPEEIHDVKVDVIGNPNIVYDHAAIDDNGDLKVTIKNVAKGTTKDVYLTNDNNIGDTAVTFRVTGEDENQVNFETYRRMVDTTYAGNTLVVSYNGTVLTKVDVIFASQSYDPVHFSIPKKLINELGITDFNKIKVSLSEVSVKVAKDSKHVLWGYVVCYYSYFKNANPNPCYIGLIRESDYLKDGYTEDYLVLAKVRFPDCNTIDLVQYLDNRNNYEPLVARDVNYIVNFNIPCIWYTKNPVNVTDAINYLEVTRVNDLRRFKYKHNKDEEFTHSHRVVNTDSEIDKKGRISVDLEGDHPVALHHLQRRVAPDTRHIKIVNVYDSMIDLEPDTTFTWDILRSKWVSRDLKWAITDDFSMFGIYNDSANTIVAKYYGYNKISPFRFIDPRTGQVAIEFDCIWSSLSTTELPVRIEEYDKAKENDILLSYYPKNHGDLDPKYISDYLNEPLNSKHNHFSYLVFRKQYLTQKYLVKLLDMLPKTPEYLVDGRLLTCVDGHIQSTIFSLDREFNHQALLRTDTLDDTDIMIKSASYWFSVKNQKTGGSIHSKDLDKPLQDKQVLVSDTEDGHKAIQSDNFIIDNDLEFGYMLISETDAAGIIHIKSSRIKINAAMTNGNIVLAKVFGDNASLDTHKYYLSTSNTRTHGSKEKLFQEQQLLVSNNDGSGKSSIESSNVIIDETLKNNHVVVSIADLDNTLHLRSSKAEISNSLAKDSLVNAKVSPDTEFIDSTGYTIGANGELEDGKILTSEDDTTRSNRKSIQSADVKLDVGDMEDVQMHPYVKISEKDADGTVHIKSIRTTIDELKYELCYKPTNIRIKDSKIHLTIDCKKKFRISISELLKTVHTEETYGDLFNYELSKENNRLFSIMVHIDVSDAQDETPDRDVSEDGTFKAIGTINNCELILINDIDCNVDEDGKKFNTYVSVDYDIYNTGIYKDKCIQWIDELRGYNTDINEADYEHEHIKGDAEDEDVGGDAPDVDDLDPEGLADDITYPPKPEDAENVMLDLSSFLTLYPFAIEYLKWASALTDNHGYGRARGKLSEIYSQTAARIIFKYVKSSEPTPSVIAGISFQPTESDQVYAYPKYYVSGITRS